MADTAAPPTGMPRINDKAPDFTAPTTQGPITLSAWQGDSWVVLFSHPADFTPVCTTELTEFARRSQDFAKRGTKLIGLSIDSIHSHLAWRENIREKLKTEINYPLIADLSQDVATKYGMIHPGASETATVRAVFVIDPKRTIRALVYYPMNVGRNVDEILRVVDALQTADKHACATPVNWMPGQKVVVPPPKTEAEVEQRKSSNHEKIDFYLNKRDLPKEAPKEVPSATH
jgi:peroxiredoxin 2/4